MKQRRYSDEQIAFALRQAENGNTVEKICRKLGVSEAMFYRRKKQFAGVGVSKPSGAPFRLPLEGSLSERMRAPTHVDFRT